MTKVDKQIESARKQASAANADVARISASLLQGVLKMPPRQAETFRTDARLTASDRDTLSRHLARKLPKQAPHTKPRPSSPSLIQVLIWPLRHMHVLLVTLAVLGIAFSAWRNTPAPFIGAGQLVYDLDVTWPDDGRLQHLKAGDVFAVLGGDSTGWRARIWRPARGYEHLLLPLDSMVKAPD